MPTARANPLQWRMVACLFVLIACCTAIGIEFRMYSAFRVNTNSVGFNPLQFGGIAAITGFMSSAFVAPVAGAAVGIYLINGAIARRRGRRGKCPSCGYQSGGVGICPECGIAPGWEQVITRASRTAARRGVICVAVAILAGAIAAEAWIAWDEHEFRAEVRALETQGGAAGYHCRPRKWPNESSSMIYEPGIGCHATD